MLFISHSSKDSNAARELAERLQARGYAAKQHFLDVDKDSGINLGDKWEKVIYDNLRDCRALIVLCSPNWLQSKWCFAELANAKMTGKEIFPVVLENCDRSSLSEYQAVFVNQDRHELREQAFERLFQVLEARGLGPLDHLVWPNPELRDVHGQVDECPFPGLPAFDERYAAVYFGRERETRVVLEELRSMRSKGEPRLLMIVGGSGSGKSSLLMAGVLPRLKHVTSRSEWLVLKTLRFARRDYDDALFEELANDIVARYSQDAHAKGIKVPDANSLRVRFARKEAEPAAKSFLEALRELTSANGCRDATVLLPIDQFEELLAPSAGTRATKFLRFLQQLCQHRNDRMLVIGTMRSDYLDIYERHPQALKAPQFHPWRLEPFPREQIEHVILKPAARVKVEVADNLLEQLKQETPTTDALPLLAFTLEKLYRSHAADKRLDLSEYRSIGGMEGSIRHTAEQIMPANSLPPNVEAAVRMCFVKHLAQVNDKGEFVRLTARWSDLDPIAYPTLEQFVAERLLIKSDRDGEVTVEVAHEAMFRCWEQLNGWLQKSADILRWRRDVARTREFALRTKNTWKGLTREQLVVSRRWPTQRRAELSQGEVDWIHSAIRWERLAIATGILVFLALIGLSIWAFTEKTNAVEFAKKATEAKKKAEDEERNAKAANETNKRLKDEAEEREYQSNVRLAQSFAETGERSKFIDLLWKYHPRYLPELEHPEFQHRGFEWNYLWRNTRLHVPPLRGHLSQLTRFVWSPDGRRIATHGDDNRTNVWDVNTGAKKFALVDLGNRPELLAWSSDSKRLIVGANDNLSNYRLRVFESDSGAVLHDFDKDNPEIRHTAWSPINDRIAAATLAELLVCDAKTGAIERHLPHAENSFGQLAWSPDGKRLAIVVDGNSVDVWRPSQKSLGTPLSVGRSEIAFLKWSPDGTKLAATSKPTTEPDYILSVTSDDQLTVWKEIERLNRDDMLWSPDGSRMASSERAIVKVWDAHSGNELQQLTGFEKAAWHLAWSADSQRLATVSSANYVAIWDVQTARVVDRFHGHAETVNLAMWSPNSSWIAIGEGNGNVLICDARLESEHHLSMTEDKTPYSFHWSHDSQHIAALCTDRVLRVWDSALRNVVRQLEIPLDRFGLGNVVWTSQPGVICISTAAPDGGGTGMASQKAMWWDANNNQVLGSFDTGTDKVYSAKVAANFQRFAVRFEDTARPPEVWDLASKQIYKLPAANKPTGEIYLSPLGKYLAVEHSDNLVDIFEIDSSRLKFTLHVKTKLAWSPNEKFIFANITDQHSAVFDAESGQRLHELENVVDYPAWSADASFLAIGTRTGKVRLWRIGSSTPEHLLPINDEHSEVWVSWTGTGHRLIASHGTSEGYRAVVHDFDLNTEFTISGLAKPATSTNWTRAGDRILSPVHNHGVLRVWHGQTGTELLDIELPDNSGGLWLWSPDGQQIAILCQDGIHFFDGRPIPEN